MPIENPGAEPLHRSRAAVGEYLETFVDKFSLRKYIEFNHKVREVKPLDGGKWLVDGEKFDKVVVATGFNSNPKMPRELAPLMKKFEAQGGEVLHFKDYKNPHMAVLAGKKLLVVGSGYSGPEVALEVAKDKNAQSVTIMQRSSVWFINRLSQHNNMPWEHAYNRLDHGSDFDVVKMVRALHGPPTGVLALEEGVKLENIKSSIAENYQEAVNDGLVNVVRKGFESVEGKTFTLEDGSKVEADVVIMCAGFAPDFSFLPAQGLLDAEYDAHSAYCLMLHQLTWADPKAFGRNLAFVGAYQSYTTYFMPVELQSRWIAGVFNGRIAPEPVEAFDFTAQRQRKETRPQFTFASVPTMTLPTYLTFMANKIGCFPSEIVGDASHPLHRAVRFGPLVMPIFRLEGPNADPEAATKFIGDLMAYYEEKGVDYYDVMATPITRPVEVPV